MNTIEKILDIARWAPSGDNSQPWRFEIIDDKHLVIHGYDTRTHCVYDLQGRASQLSIGTLLETISIAASTHGLGVEFQARTDMPETTPTFDAFFKHDPELKTDPLATCIPVRTVQRRPMRTRPLSKKEKSQLESSTRPDYRIMWLEGFANRLRAALLTFKNAGLRLTLPEAYPTHRDIIEWNARYSEDRIPDQAVGADPITLKLMHWALKSWERVNFMNRYLAGTLMPRLQLDLIPGLACAAHFMLVAKNAPETINDYIAAGRAVQRFWLTATSLGLYIQPEMTPLIFHNYIKNGVQFSNTDGMNNRARVISRKLEHLIGEKESMNLMFMGRIGAGPAPSSRSVRLPLTKLMK